ncbi:AAA family ATPase [Labrys wisconsinensis]|uniref:AAA+ ATPase domain-containing protein n=1 Tax=Labrys wisconsinensis TaxID=425677 RepID=A0ABU0J1A3_9HYPH|nr:AAA family ATPase [Labrys wisconsinensis]MDQ0467012.1 hypothetical protein [Labrys wisconsinensis]
MIKFPVFKRLRVENYGLYPGIAGQSGLDIAFERGPTLIAGVNGLGKSTLIAIMLRSLTGPFDLPRPAQDGDLGEVEPEAVPLNPRPLFAPRVADKAENATATIEVDIGGHSLIIQRRLSDLSIQKLSVDSDTGIGTDEGLFQAKITDLMGAASFFDTLLILRYVVFFLEDRRALVWGRTAQRELLRALFVSSGSATELSRVRYEMLSADSAYRNLRNVLNRRIKENDQEIARLTTVTGVRTELSVLETTLDATRVEEDELNRLIAQKETIRQEARLRSANAALERDSAVRELERIKVHALSQKFSALDDNSIYVLARLASEDHCLACETRRAGLGAQVTARLMANECVVCGTQRHPGDDDAPIDLSAERILDLQERIRASEVEIESNDRNIKRSEELRRQSLEALIDLAHRKAQTTEMVRRLRSQLPSTDRSADDLDERNRELRRLIEDERLSYERHRSAFEVALGESQSQVTRSQNKVATAFARYAGEFLKERCKIAFQPVNVRIGQSGGEFEVGLFQLSISGGALGGETPRTEPDQVSMSQREFLDLAFRMALMTVASGDGPSTLVVDTPEASLDFLFAERAGNQLARFAREGGTVGNRVVVTSNLANPELIPALLKGRPDGQSARSRVVDLIKIAAANAAVREDGARYEIFLEDRIRQAEA